MNKNISLWRGNDSPPTIYHLWFKSDGKLYAYLNQQWQQITSDNEIDFDLEEINQHIDERLNDQLKPLIQNDVNKSIRQIAEDVMLNSASGIQILSEEEYASKKENNEIINNMMYFIIVDNEPYEMYIGSYLIAKKGELQNISFPYTFPIIFN